MKFKFRIVLILLCLFSFRIKAQWSSVSVGTTANISCVNYTSSQQIILGGAGCTVMSSDGGNNWLIQPLTDTFNNLIPGSHIYDIYPLTSQQVSSTGQLFGGNSQVVLGSFNNTTTWFVSYTNNAGTNPKLFWDIDFANSLIGYAVGTHGRIIKTVNGGLSWTLQSTPTTAELYGVDFVSPTTGIAVGDNVILRTVDGGITWTAQTNTWFLKSIHFPTANTGYAVGSNGVILKSTDAGATWNLLSISNLTTAAYNEVWFTAQDTGYAVAGSLIFKTVDGGQVWTYTAFPAGTVFRSIHFLDANNGYAVGTNGTVYKTSNAGGPSAGHPIAGFTTTITQLCGSTTLDVTDISGAGFTYQWLLNGSPFSTSYNISNSYSVTTTELITLIISNSCCSDTISRSITIPVQQPISVTAGTDQNYCGSPVQLTASGTGTFSWTPTSGLSNSAISNPVASPAVTTTYTVMLTNGLCSAIDQVIVSVFPIVTADNWTPTTLFPNDAITNVNFIDANHGFAMKPSGICKTNNGGATWTYSLSASMGLNEGVIDCIDYNKVWVASSALKYTANGGTSWTSNPMTGITYNSFYDKMKDVFFVSPTTGYVIFLNVQSTPVSKIAKTTDGGATWSLSYIGVNERLASIYGVGADTVYCAGTSVTTNAPILYKSVNAGNTWLAIPFPGQVGTIIQEIEFLDKNYGFFVGNGNVYKTSDGGTTWSLNYVPAARTVEIINYDTIYIGGDKHVYKTFNGGVCWSDMGIQTPQIVHDICFPNRQLIVGYFGTADNISQSNAIVKRTILTSAQQLVFTLSRDSVCSGQQFTFFNGSVGYQSYQWFINNSLVGTTQDYSANLIPGSYQITLVGTHSTGSDTATQTLTFSGNSLSVSLTLSQTLFCSNAPQQTLSGGLPTGGTFSGPGVIGNTFDPTQANIGTNIITYTYADIYGCIGSDFDTIQVDVCTGINTLLANNDFIISPNPNDGTFVLQLKKTEATEIMIYDAFGQLVSTQKVQPNDQQQLKIANSGIYLITVITTNGQRESKRVIVNK